MLVLVGFGITKSTGGTFTEGWGEVGCKDQDQSRKCAMNKLRITKQGSCQGEGPGDHTNCSCQDFSLRFQVFSGPPTGLT